MALARCRKRGRPEGRTENYVVAAMPVGYPDTAAICGRAGCEQPALIWLTDCEKADYDNKRVRTFALKTATVKLRVTAISQR